MGAVFFVLLRCFSGSLVKETPELLNCLYNICMPLMVSITILPLKLFIDK